NASPSSSGLVGNYVELVSGVFLDNRGLDPLNPPTLPLSGPPTPIAVPAGLVGTTMGTGTMGSASSVLMPNPETGPNTPISTPFASYRRFTCGQFAKHTRSGPISGGSTIAAVPEPASLAAAGTALPLLALAAWRRRRKA